MQNKDAQIYMVIHKHDAYVCIWEQEAVGCKLNWKPLDARTTTADWTTFLTTQNLSSY